MTFAQIVLAFLAGGVAGLAIRARMRENVRGETIFKPLATALIIVIALITPDPISRAYHVLIVLGLLASLAGDVLQLPPDDRPLPGLVSFLVAHLCYIAAFTVAGDGLAPWYYLLPFVVYGAIMLVVLWPHLESLRGPVVVYVVVILIMGYQAANRWLETGQDGTLLALIGAYCFIASNSVLAIERFRGAWRSAPFWVLSLYWIAQLLIALSI